jgi:hypothetical protein
LFTATQNVEARINHLATGVQAECERKENITRWGIPIEEVPIEGVWVRQGRIKKWFSNLMNGIVVKGMQHLAILTEKRATGPHGGGLG